MELIIQQWSDGGFTVSLHSLTTGRTVLLCETQSRDTVTMLIRKYNLHRCIMLPSKDRQ